MTAINAVTDYALDGDVGVITLNSPPVNALSFNVRDGLAGGMAAALADPGAKAIVIICEGRTFIAGADITEFGGPQKGASLFDVQDAMENSTKPSSRRFTAPRWAADWKWRSVRTTASRSPPRAAASRK